MKSVPWLAALCGVMLLGGIVSLDAQEKKRKRADLFGPEKIWNIHLTLSAKEYQTMQPKGGGGFGFGFPKKDAPPIKKDDPKPKDDIDSHKNKAFGIDFPWALGDLDFEGTVVKNVAIRYKGNSTYQMSQQGLKRPFKIDVNHYIEDQKLHGMNGFGLGNGIADPTRIREALAFSLFRAAKVPASRTAFAKVSLTVSDKYDKTYVGLYTLIEPVDKPFLKQHFKSDKGMLLKPERIQGLMYMGEKWDAYKNYNPKREPTEEQKRRLIEFAKLVSISDDATFKKKIGDYLDVDGFLRFAAVNSLISNLDSFFGLGHNYFLYLSPTTNQLHFIPWDLDLSFGSMNFGGGDSAEWAIGTPYTGKNRLTERILAMKEHNDAYRKHMKTLTDTVYNPKAVNATITTFEATIKDALAKEPKTGGPGFMGMGPGGKPLSLRDFVKKRSDSVVAQLDGKSEGKILAGFGFGGKGPPGGKGPGFGAFGMGNVLAKPIIEAIDTNKDAKVSLDEFKTAAGKLFKEAGGDDKTPVAEAELIDTINKLMPPPPAFGGFKPPPPPKGFGPGKRIAAAIVKFADVGAEKKLTRAQFLGGAEKLFKQWDKDKSGHLDEKEIIDGLNQFIPPPEFGPGFGPPPPPPADEKKK